MLLVEGCRLERPGFSASYALAVPAGAMCALVGPSGGGKTTLIDLIAGFARPLSGGIGFMGRDLAGLAPGERPVALVFQDNNLFPHLTVAENVALGVAPSLHLDAGETARVTEALDLVELGGLAARRPGELSGGQRQRVALARALASERPLLLLDEPFSALDPGLRKGLIRAVDALRQRLGLTVVMTSHAPDEVAPFVDQMAFVTDGRVIATGAPAAVLDPGRDPRIATFLGERFSG